MSLSTEQKSCSATLRCELTLEDLLRESLDFWLRCFKQKPNTPLLLDYGSVPRSLEPATKFLHEILCSWFEEYGLRSIAFLVGLEGLEAVVYVRRGYSVEDKSAAPSYASRGSSDRGPEPKNCQ